MRIFWFLILISPMLFGQEPKATIYLDSAGSLVVRSIVNAPSGRDWSMATYGVAVYDGYDTLLIDNEEFDKISYYGNWRHSTDGNFGKPPTGAPGCSCSYSNGVNDSIVINFTDASTFIWYGELMSHHGIADIYFDDQYLGPVDTYDLRNLAVTQNWRRDDLDPNRVYKFKVVVTGRKNADSSGAYIVNHGFKMWKDEFVEPPDPELCIPDTIYIYETDTLMLWDTVYVKKEIIIRDTIWGVPIYQYKFEQEKP